MIVCRAGSCISNKLRYIQYSRRGFRIFHPITVGNFTLSTQNLPELCRWATRTFTYRGGCPLSPYKCKDYILPVHCYWLCTCPIFHVSFWYIIIYVIYIICNVLFLWKSQFIALVKNTDVYITFYYLKKMGEKRK